MATETALTAREAWLAERNSPNYIGASEVAAALGFDKYKSPYALWAEKSGKIHPEDLSDNEAVEFGLRIEGIALETFAERTGRKCELWTPYKIVRHRDYTWFGTTPDAWQIALPEEREAFHWKRDTGLLQIKNVGEYRWREWRDEAPKPVQIQCQAELAVTGLQWTTALALIGGNKLRWFDIQRDDEFIATMIPLLAEFRDRILADDPPPPDDSESCARALDELYPRGRAAGKEILLPDKCLLLDVELQALKEEEKTRKSQMDRIKNQLKSAIGDAEIGRLSSGAAYRLLEVSKKEFTVKASTYSMLKRIGEK